MSRPDARGIRRRPAFLTVGTAKRGRAAKHEIQGHCVIGKFSNCVIENRIGLFFLYNHSNYSNYTITQSLPFSGFDQLADLALHQVALERADMADVELAVEVIGFMQEGAGQQFFSGFFENVPVHVLGTNGDLIGATLRSRGNREC